MCIRKCYQKRLKETAMILFIGTYILYVVLHLSHMLLFIYTFDCLDCGALDRIS